ncbi:MAG: phosphoribosylamine--glycine ligase [Bdellovibrionota bacterium]
MPRLNHEFLSKPIAVAVLGSGGREHALARKIAESVLCEKVTVLPGNAGMLLGLPARLSAKVGIETTDLTDHPKLISQLKKLGVGLVVVGPDDLLADGIVDSLEDAGLLVFGPRQGAARIESSKVFAKTILEKASIPTARHRTIREEDLPEVGKIIDSVGGFPVVLKYDGLALGKGVRICIGESEAKAFLADIFERRKFSRNDSVVKPLVVAEEFLSGHEVSLFALTDGTTYVALEAACDHKHLYEGNYGPNTGGMGAYSPVPWLDRTVIQEIADKVFPAALAQMAAAKSPFKGLLYAGLMVREKDYWVLEFNARFGDPETQVILPRLESDLLPLLYGVAMGDLKRYLDSLPPRWTSQSCVNIVAASRGYPERPDVGYEISGAENLEGVHIYFAGVQGKDSKLYNSGGRVFSISALANSIEGARFQALEALEKVKFEGMYFRRDIGAVGPGY